MDFMEPKRRRRVGRSSLPRELLLCCLCLCFFSSVFALAAVNRNEANSPQSASSRTETHSQGRRGGSTAAAWARRRSLGGPGSYPPRCAGKCGKCTPCKPVHVPVPPGTPVTTEYYPEAWRCKCGNRLYMP